jgi:hypothetical protein
VLKVIQMFPQCYKGARQEMFPQGSGFGEFDIDAKKREKASIGAVMM